MARFRPLKICIWPAFLVVMVAAAKSTTAAPAPGTFQVQVVADDMCCNGCAQTVAGQLYALPGITSVQSDVPKRTVTVTGKLSPKLTLARIWQAVEKGKGGPSKLVSQSATYALTPAEKLMPDVRLASGQYVLEVGMLENNDDVQAIADQLYRIPGVDHVGVDVPQRKFAIQASAASAISPWALISAAERAQARPISVSGPFGVFIIERAAMQDPPLRHNVNP